MSVENVEAYVICDICCSAEADIQLIEIANGTWGIDETDELLTNDGEIWSCDFDGILECNFCLAKEKGDKDGKEK